MNLRKCGALFLALALTLSLCLVPAAAAESDFTIENGVLTIYNGNGGDVTIPDGVTTIGEGAFTGTALESITLPNSLKAIDQFAFHSCTALKSVTIPDGVTTIGRDAFWGCTELTSVTLPKSLKTINAGTFYCCTALKNVTIPYGVTKIDGSFQDIQSITGGGAFGLCTALTSITLPDSVTDIGEWAFGGYSGLTSIILPKSLKTIGRMAFSYCPELKSVTIPGSVTTIGEGAFSSCEQLTIYGVPGSATEAYAKRDEIPFVGGQANAPEAVPTAYASTQIVLLDGKEVSFAAYALKDPAGNLTNYLKVRDVASALNGTAAQFNVSWSGSVLLKSKEAYSPNGSEMKTPYTGNQPYQEDPSAVKVDGVTAKIGGIVLKDAKGNGYTYYKLRDLGTALGFKVDWNGKNITIDTTKTGAN